MTCFVHTLLGTNGRYHPALILLATSRQDPASVHLLQPGTWQHGLHAVVEQSNGYAYQRVGALFSEIEIQRYRPRRVLTDILNQFDLIQVVSGSPAYAAAAQEAAPPVCIFSATTIKQDRAARLRRVTGLKRLWLQWMTDLSTKVEHRALTQAEQVFALSQYTFQQFASHVAAHRLRLAPVGVDAEFFSPGRSYRADGHILCVGRLDDYRKNIKVLLAAYARLRQQLKNAPRLALATITPLRAEDLAYAQKAGIADFIDVYLDVGRVQMRELYRGAAVFALSSDEEGLGIVILEAMACGLPVLSTDCGGPATLIQHGETGLLTPVGDVAAFSEAWCRLLEDSDLRQRMGQAGRARVEEFFSLPITRQVYLNVYDDLLAY